MKIGSRLLLLCLVTLIPASLVSPEAASDDSSYLARLSQLYQLELQPNPRILGMGGTYAATSRDIDGLVGNPAALGSVDRVMVTIDGGWWELDSQGDSDIYAQDDVDADFWQFRPGAVIPVQDLFVLGLHYQYRGGEDDLDFDSDFDYDRHVWSVDFAKEILEDEFSLGYRFHYFRDEREGTRTGGETEIPSAQWALVVPYEWDSDYENDAFLHTVGAQWNALDNLTLGLLVEYGHGDPELDEELVLGDFLFLSEDTPPPQQVRDALIDAFNNDVLPVLMSDYTLHDDDGDQDEIHVRGGVAWQTFEGGPLVGLDLAYQSDEIEWDTLEMERDEISVHLGAEHEFTEILSGRLGYSYANVDTDVNVNNAGIAGDYESEIDIHTVSAGFGLDFDSVRVDYGFGFAIDSESESNMMHLVGVTIPF